MTTPAKSTLYVNGAGKAAGFNRNSLFVALATLAGIVGDKFKVTSVMEKYAVIEVDQATGIHLTESAKATKVKAPNGEEITLLISEKLEEVAIAPAPETAGQGARGWIGDRTPTRLLTYLMNAIVSAFKGRHGKEAGAKLFPEALLKRLDQLVREPLAAQLIELLVMKALFLRIERYKDLSNGKTPKATARDRADVEPWDLTGITADQNTMYIDVTCAFLTDSDRTVKEGGELETWPQADLDKLWILLENAEAREAAALMAPLVHMAEVLDYKVVEGLERPEAHVKGLMETILLEEERKFHFFKKDLAEAKADKKPGQKRPVFHKRPSQGTSAPARVVDVPANADALAKAAEELKAKEAESTETAAETVEKTEPKTKPNKSRKAAEGKGSKGKTPKAPEKDAEEEKTAAH